MRAVLLVALAGALAGFAPSATTTADAAPPVITFSCTPAPSDCTGWFTANVTVKWEVSGASVSNCPTVTVAADTKGQAISCTATNADGQSTTVTVTVKLDKTAPAVAGANPSRPADADGWYNRAVTLAFAGTDATSGIASCTSVSYSGPDNGAAVVPGTCRDAAGNTSAPAGVTIKYDATAPEVRPAPARAPDANGWYNHALSVPFTGSDATSGVAECTTASYAGPDAAEAVLRGSCRDRAGNTAEAGFALRYDATPPTIERVAAAAGDGTATLSWRASADTTLVELVRTPGRGGKQPSIVFRGKASAFRDTKLRNGIRYRYQVAAFDQAGNASRKELALKPLSPLLRPAAGARVRTAPLLAWRPVAGARFYNVQLHRGGKKILTVWPRRTRLRLPTAWVFGGRAYRLTPGRYTWYVWPYAKGRFGRLIGSRSFTVVR